MKRFISSLLVIVMMISLVSSAFGANLTDAEKLKLYETKKKDPRIAAGLNSIPLLPLGHLYAGNVLRGYPFTIGEMLGIILMAVPTTLSKDINSSTATAGAYIFCGSWVWGIFDAYWTAEDYNTKLKEKIDNTQASTYEVESIGIMEAMYWTVIPSAGHAYAGNWQRGWPFLAAYLGAVVFLQTEKSSSGEKEFNDLGKVVVVGTKIWEMYDVYNMVEDHNKKIRQEKSLSLQFRNNLPVLAYTYSF